MARPPFPLEPDFQLLFEATPTPYIVLTPDFTIVAANEARLRATMTVREEIVGRGLFEVFPDNPDDPTSNGVRNLRASLMRVLQNKTSDAMPIQKYDIPAAGGKFEVRYWSPLNIPVFDASGEVAYIIHQVQDVTTQVLRQQALEESEAHFRQIANALPQMIWSALPDGRPYYFNQQWYRFIGVAAAASDGDEWIKFLHPDDRQRTREVWTRSIISGDPYEIQYRMRHYSGQYRWVLCRGTPVRNAKGVIERWMGTCTDIQEQRIAEDARKETECRLRRIVDSDVTGIYQFHHDGRIVESNDKFLEMLGYTRREFEQHGLSWQTLTPPEWQQADREAMDQIRSKGRTGSFEKQYFRKDGSRLPVFVGATTLGQDREEGVAYVLDFSKLKKAQLEVQESEIRFRTLAENIPQLAWMANRDGEIFWYNNRWFEYTGTSMEDMRGWGWMSVHHPDFASAVKEKYCRDIVELQVTWEDIFPLRAADGTYRWFLSRAVPIRDLDGRIVRWFGTNTDVTDQRHAEEALQQENRRKDDFLAMLAHELRNPLAPISTAAELLALARHDAQQVARCSDIIVRQTRHMTELVDDLLDVSRVTRGLVSIEREDVPIKDVVNSAIEQVRPLVESRDQGLTIRFGAANAVVLGDRTRLIQAVTNLLNNAAKYTPRRGEIELCVEAKAAEVCVSVSDNGSGIDAGLLPHVFDLFAQGERTPDRSQGGLGLGLALVKSIMALHGGSASAKSDGPGKGSTFTLVLPVVKKDAEAVEPSPDAGRNAAPRRSLRIQIVDDNLDAAETLAAFLREQGNQVTICEAAQCALEQAKVARPHVYILDIGLPDFDGYELSRRLHDLPESRDSLFIALTGYGQAHDKVLAKAAGFDHYFVKPMDVSALQKVLTPSA